MIDLDAIEREARECPPHWLIEVRPDEVLALVAVVRAAQKLDVAQVEAESEFASDSTFTYRLYPAWDELRAALASFEKGDSDAILYDRDGRPIKGDSE